MTISLVTNYGSLVHRATCYAVRRSRGVRGLAPEIEEDEVLPFLKARGLEPCGACFPKIRAQIAEELAAEAMRMGWR